MQNSDLKLKTHKSYAFGFDFSLFNTGLRFWLVAVVFGLVGCRAPVQAAPVGALAVKPTEVNIVEIVMARILERAKR